MLAVMSARHVLVLALLLSCKRHDAPAAAPVADKPGSAAPADAAVEVDDGVRQVILDMKAAVAKYDSAKASAIGEALKPSKEWWNTTFGDELGPTLYHDYVNTEELGSQSIETLMRVADYQHQSEVHVVKLTGPADPESNGYQTAALAAMKKPVPLYTVRLTRPGERDGMTLWSFTSIDGKPLYLGRMHALVRSLPDPLIAELPVREGAALPVVDWATHLRGSPPAASKRVFLAIGSDKQLVERTIDGSSTRVLATGYDDAEFVPELGLVWLVKKGSVDVLDLRQDGSHPVPIVTTVGEDGADISWKLGDREGQVEVGLPAGAVTFGSGEVSFMPNGEDNVGCKLVGKKWLESQHDRSVDPPVAASFPTTGGALKCAGCTRSIPFGASALSLVPWTIPDFDGKREFRMEYEKLNLCELYDPATGALGRPAGQVGGALRAMGLLAGTCVGYLFDATGKAVLHDQIACDESACVQLDGSALGWLKGNVEVALPAP